MTKYEEYVALQKEIDVLEGKKNLLRDDISAILPAEGFKNETINALWRTSKKITYPEDVKTLESNVKEAIKPIEEKYQAEIKPLLESVEVAKKLAEDNGTVTVEEKKTLAITVK